MCMAVLPTCSPTHHVCSAHDGQKRVSDPLRLELQKVVSHPVRLGIEPRSTGREASALK